MFHTSAYGKGGVTGEDPEDGGLKRASHSAAGLDNIQQDSKGTGNG